MHKKLGVLYWLSNTNLTKEDHYLLDSLGEFFQVTVAGIDMFSILESAIKASSVPSVLVFDLYKLNQLNPQELANVSQISSHSPILKVALGSPQYFQWAELLKVDLMLEKPFLINQFLAQIKNSLSSLSLN